MFRTLIQRAAKSAPRAKVPNVIASLGHHEECLSFVSHPGVMAIAKILEQYDLIGHKANFTQENVDAIREFDEELADKAQKALDNNLKINFMELEHINNPEFLKVCLEEKSILEQARQEVIKMPKGVYDQPKCLANYRRADTPWALHKYAKAATAEHILQSEQFLGPMTDEFKAKLKKEIDLDYDKEVAKLDAEFYQQAAYTIPPSRGKDDVLPARGQAEVSQEKLPSK